MYAVSQPSASPAKDGDRSDQLSASPAKSGIAVTNFLLRALHSQ